MSASILRNRAPLRPAHPALLRQAGEGGALCSLTYCSPVGGAVGEADWGLSVPIRAAARPPPPPFGWSPSPKRGGISMRILGVTMCESGSLLLTPMATACFGIEEVLPPHVGGVFKPRLSTHFSHSLLGECQRSHSAGRYIDGHTKAAPCICCQSFAIPGHLGETIILTRFTIECGLSSPHFSTVFVGSYKVTTVANIFSHPVIQRNAAEAVR